MTTPVRTVTIIVPVYNEAPVIAASLRRVLAADLGFAGLEKQVVVVNDGSTDGTAAALAAFRDVATIVDVATNRGKGHAVRVGLTHATGEVVVIQDADLEYDPADYPRLLKPIVDGVGDVVYGSRFVGGSAHRIHFFWHSAGNRCLTLLANLAANLNLTDMETGSKAFRTEALRSVRLAEDRFGFEPEVTIRLAQQRWRFYEVGVSYAGRTYAEGKKVSWRDGVRALWVILRCGVSRPWGARPATNAG